MAMDDRQEANERFAANLRRERERKGLSQEALADRAGLSRGYVGRLEGGGIECRVFTLHRLALALEAEPGALVDGIEWEPNWDGTGRYKVSPRPLDGSRDDDG
jgi:transcriptional regulator with XRE-family HTH domain